MTVDQLLNECDIVRATPQRLAQCKPFSCDEDDLDEFFAKDCLINQHYYEKNGFKFLIDDERLEAKYMGIGVGRLPLNTRLMYFDLLKIKVDDE